MSDAVPFTAGVPAAPLPKNARVRDAMLLDYRQRFALEQAEKAATRQHELAQQRSELNPPEVRIRHWEKLHGLSLPPNPAHPILHVIASATGLTILEVQACQRQRFS